MFFVPLCSLCRVSVWIKDLSTWPGNRWGGALQACTLSNIPPTFPASPWFAQQVNSPDFCFSVFLQDSNLRLFREAESQMDLRSPPLFSRSGVPRRDRVHVSTEEAREESTRMERPDPLHLPGDGGHAEPLLPQSPQPSSAGRDQALKLRPCLSFRLL